MPLKQILHFALGPVGGALLGIMSLPIIAWLFSQEDVGKMALLQVVLSFATLFFTLGLDQGYVREFHDSLNKPQLLKSALLPGFTVLLISLMTCLLFGSFLSELVFSIQSTFVSWILAIAVLSSFLSRFLSLVLRMNERGLAFSMSQVLPKIFVLCIIFSYFQLNIEKTFENLLLANTLSIVFACLIFFWNTRTEWHLSFSCKIDIQQLKKMLRFGFPLIFSGIAFWGLTSVDRVMLSRWSNYSELAIYSVSVSFAAAATIFQSVFSTVWAPTVYKWASNNEGHDKVIMVNRYVLMLVVILFCLAGLFSWIVPLILPSEYTSVQWILVACIAYPLLYTLSETTVVGIGISRKSSYAMLAAVLALLVNLLCNYFLIPLFGAAGAASSTALSFWFFLVCRTEFSIHVWRPMPRIALYGFTFLIVVGAVIVALLQERIILYSYLYWLMLLLGSCYFFKSEVFFIKNKFFFFIQDFFKGKH
ncbi:oligosaccharide flippase family protein [Aeromonas sp. V90_14]|uniref:lipopolysaccharide biosynthesis protein n=1 Tax=Aeromonas sp. V90_14 TaxID=3044241 RepID=UPI00249F446B|nr:oligosaccharide flippase family protein [Aeromonas sp. V90_14]MDI3428901.1 oligosaccharide flippase family protein [Aeromonas sp. V90_14]